VGNVSEHVAGLFSQKIKMLGLSTLFVQNQEKSKNNLRWITLGDKTVCVQYNSMQFNLCGLSPRKDLHPCDIVLSNYKEIKMSMSRTTYIVCMVFNPFSAPGSISEMLLLLSVLMNRQTNRGRKFKPKKCSDKIYLQCFVVNRSRSLLYDLQKLTSPERVKDTC